MGITLKMQNSKPEDALFKALLNDADMPLLATVTEHVNPKFAVGFHSVIASFYPCGGIVPSDPPGSKKKEIGINLPVTTTSILTGKVTSEQKALCRSHVMNLLKAIANAAGVDMAVWVTGADELSEEFNAMLQNTAYGQPSIVGMDLAKAEKMITAAIQTMPIKPVNPDTIKILKEMVKGAANNPANKPANKPALNLPPVPLKDAVAIGQRVKGTSAGSVYTVTALSETVRLAMRYKDDQLSVRAEGNPNPFEVKKMEEFGLSKGNGNNGTYWSMHMSLAGVPVQRVIGAVLMGLGIDFDHVMTNAKGVLHANNK